MVVYGRRRIGKTVLLRHWIENQYAEHKTVKPPEWLSLLHDKLARIVAKILYARETSKPEKQDLDLSGPAA